MRIETVNAGTFGQMDGASPRHVDTPAPEPKAECRALVVLEPPRAAHDRDRPMAYRDAPFLAQLIATNAQLPQTRTRRRAEPEEAVAMYRAVAKLVA